MRGPYVDRLLADADGALAPIWISALLITPSSPSPARLRAALDALVDETPRLRVAWDSVRSAWRPIARSPGSVSACVRERPGTSLRAFGEALFSEPIDLSRELPVRLTTATLSGPGAHRLGHQVGRQIVALQLHHALGDARSLMFLNRRLWEHASGSLGATTRLGDPEMSDARALREALRHPLGIASAARPKNRVLASRGLALRRSGTSLGAPALVSLRVPISETDSPNARSALFFGALLGAIARALPTSETGLPVRLRVPVDLRRALGIGTTLENACSAVAIEVPLGELLAACTDPGRLGRLVTERLGRRLAVGTQFGTLVENMLVSRIATREMLRRHLRPDLLAAVRASTLVATYVGSVDRYFQAAPFPIDSLQTQTPTWGANGLAFRDALMINVTGFDGLWPRDEHVAFVSGMREWLRRYAGRPSEILE